MQYKIAYVHYYIHKVFGVVSGGGGGGGMMQQRDLDVTTSHSDVALSNQNVLIPSYSEAMRMDHCGRTDSSTELLTCQTIACARDVELGSDAPGSGAAALVPLQRGCHDRTSLLSASAVSTSRRTVYGTAICDHRAGRAFFQCPARRRSERGSVSVQQSRSVRDDGGGSTVPVCWRSRRRPAAVHKRKRRRSYAEAVGAPSGSDTSLAVSRVDQQVRAQRRGRTSSAAAGDDVVGAMTTSMSTPESFEKLQNASAWVEQLRPVKSFVEGGIRSSINDDDNVDVNRDSSCTTLVSADGNHAATASASAAAVPAVNISSELAAHSAYDVVGRRVVRCRRDWIDHIVDDDDDDEDLPPSYEDALRMRVVPHDAGAAGIMLDDISSVSTTSTYLSSELGVNDTPRRWKTFVRRPYAIVNPPPPFHVETSL